MWLNPDICENTVNANLIKNFFSMLRFHDVLTHAWSHLIRQQMSSFFCPLPCGQQKAIFIKAVLQEVLVSS